MPVHQIRSLVSDSHKVSREKNEILLSATYIQVIIPVHQNLKIKYSY